MLRQDELNKAQDPSSGSTRRRRPTRATYQAMEALIHNLNTMNSRAGAQVPFSSINYGMDTSPEGRMVMRNVLLATEAGLGNGETPIFPIQIFQREGGRQLQPRRPQLRPVPAGHAALSAKRLFPNFSFVDAPFNLQYYKPGHPETEIAYMGCRTRVIGNVYDPTREICPRPRQPELHLHQPAPASPSRPRATSDWFFEELERMLRSGASISCWSGWRSSCQQEGLQLPLPDGRRACGSTPKSWDWTDDVAGGAQARHPVHRLHRPGGSPEGPDAVSITARATTARTWAWRSWASCANACDECSQREKLNFTLSGHPRRGSVRPLCPHRQGEVRHHPRRDRPGILHQLLPCAGVLSHQRL